MKILILTEFIPGGSRAEITGGVEARCYYVGKLLDKAGHEVLVLARPTTGGEWAYSSPSSLFGRITYCARALAKGLWTDFDIVEGTNFVTYPLAWLIGSIRRKPVIFWYADVFVGSWVKNVGTIGLLGEVVERLVLKLPVHKYIAISGSTRKKLIAGGVKPEKIEVIGCGYDPEELPDTGEATKRYDLCTVSRLVTYKKVDDLIRAVAILEKSFPGISLVVVGQGPERERLEQLTLDLKLDDNVTFLGHVPSHKAVLETVSSASVYCHPSIVEGFGIAVIEAAALGVPLVVADIPTLVEVTRNGMGGYLFRAENYEDLAEKIKLLLLDRKLYEEKSTQARELAKKHDWQTVTDGTLYLYRSLIQ